MPRNEDCPVLALVCGAWARVGEEGEEQTRRKLNFLLNTGL